jgi:hypothetical protein
LQDPLLEFIPPSLSFIPSSLHSWNSFSMSHFSISIHEYIVFPLHSPSYTLSLYLPPSHWYQLPNRTYFTFLFFIFRKSHFCLFKIPIQGVSLWYFHVYMYYNLNWFIPPIFLLSTLVFFLWWLQKVSKFYIHIESTSTSLFLGIISAHIHLTSS